MKIPLLSFLFLTPFYFILLKLDIDVVSGQCLEDQQSLLLQLKSNLTFKSHFNSLNLARWNRSSDCCTWNRITCDENGRVIGLDFGGLGINGSTDYSSVFSLKYLELLDLSYNRFDSRILSKIGNFTNLTYLSSLNAGFIRPILIEIS